MKKEYNTVVVGGGAAGLVSSYLCAALKARVALIEKDAMGGDCLNTGCVPSKALIKTAKFVADMKRHQSLGIKSVSYELDFPMVMERVRQTVKKIEPHDSVERYTGLGVECLKGTAEILSPHEVKVDSKVLSCRNIILAHGAEPFIPKIPGLESIDFLSSENLWSLSELPKRLVVLGGGPIGSELSQAFARLGSEVTQIEQAPRILMKEDPEVSELMSQVLKKDGVKILTGSKALRIERKDEEKCVVCVDSSGNESMLAFDQILLAVGRKARTAGVDWEQIGVSLREDGTIAVDEYLCANGKNIYAAGDVTGPYQFTHTAAHQAYYAAVNSLFRPVRFKANYRVIPWVTYTDPEVARVGMNEQEAKAAKIDYEVHRYDLDDLDRAITESEDHGFVKVLTNPKGKGGEILGATIAAHSAGELNTEFVAAMQHGFGLNKILGTVHPYPTMSEANKYTAGIWKRTQAKPWLMEILRRFHAWKL